MSAQQQTVEVPIKMIEAVAHIGCDFGYGEYHLEPEYIKLAQEIMKQLSKTE